MWVCWEGRESQLVQLFSFSSLPSASRRQPGQPGRQGQTLPAALAGEAHGEAPLHPGGPTPRPTSVFSILLGVRPAPARSSIPGLRPGRSLHAPGGMGDPPMHSREAPSMGLSGPSPFTSSWPAVFIGTGVMGALPSRAAPPQLNVAQPGIPAHDSQRSTTTFATFTLLNAIPPPPRQRVHCSAAAVCAGRAL